MPDILSIILANYREFCSPFDRFLPPDEREVWRLEDFDAADNALFWRGDHKIVLLPRPLDPAHLADVCAALSYTDVRVWTPAHCTDDLCRDLQADETLFARLVETVRAAPEVEFITWGVTPSFYELLARLRALGLQVRAPEAPAAEDAWTRSYFDSKAGFRALALPLAARHPALRLPEGFICGSFADACETANYFARRRRSFLLKANSGVAGWGIRICRYSDQPGAPDPYAELLAMPAENLGLWDNGPVMVEAFIDAGPPAAGQPLNPTVDGVVHPDGQVEVKFTGNMLIQAGTQYRGVALGAGALPDRLAQEIETVARVLGAGLAQYGYAGWFDVDFVVDADGQPYATEINARRTGPTHAYEIYARLREHFPGQIGAALSNDDWESPDFEYQNYAQVKARLAAMLFPIAGQPRGLIISMTTPLSAGRGKIGYVVLGRDLDDALALERQARQLAR